MESPKATRDGNRRARPLLKAHHHPSWKEKLRQNCLKRVQEDRANLLWKLRLSGCQAPEQKDTVESAFMGIVATELKKIKQSTLNDDTGISTSGCDDLLWEYDGHQMDYLSAESNYEELLIEMERCLYEDLREELTRKELDFYQEEDEYLAQAVFEHMQLNDGQASIPDVNMTHKLGQNPGKDLLNEWGCPRFMIHSMSYTLCFHPFLIRLSSFAEDSLSVPSIESSEPYKQTWSLGGTCIIIKQDLICRMGTIGERVSSYLTLQEVWNYLDVMLFTKTAVAGQILYIKESRYPTFVVNSLLIMYPFIHRLDINKLAVPIGQALPLQNTR